MSGRSRGSPNSSMNSVKLLDVDGQRAGQEDGPFRAPEVRFDSLLRPPARLSVEDELGQTQGVFDSDAAVAEGARVLVEQFPRRRIVQVDRMVVRKHEGDSPERVIFARQLAHVRPTPKVPEWDQIATLVTANPGSLHNVSTNVQNKVVRTFP